MIVGGGPSLSLKQINHLAMARLSNKCRVIAVNNSIYPCWFADWLHGCDFKWWNWHKEAALKFTGIKTTCTETTPAIWAHYIEVAPVGDDGLRTGFAPEPHMVEGGGNGGYQAIQLAVKAGSPKVLLLGFDMRISDDQAHWFGDHPDRIRSNYEGTMLPNFPGLAVALKERGVECINCSPGSALTDFPMARMEDVL